MAAELVIEQVHRPSDPKRLNEEWLALANSGDAPFNTEGCSITVSRAGGGRPRIVTTLKAGLVIQPGEKVRLVSGSSGKKSHGDAPSEEGWRNVHLFLKGGYLDRPGLTVRLVSRQRELCRGQLA